VTAAGSPDDGAVVGRRPRMSFSVDGWDPSYGTSLELEEDLGESSAEVDVGIELPAKRWQPIPFAGVQEPPCPTLFIDGVRRIEARVWIDDASTGTPANEASAAICASYAAGVVCCCDSGAHFLSADTRRGLFTVAPHAEDIVTSAVIYTATPANPNPAMPLSVTLSSALQGRLADVELAVALGAREESSGHSGGGDDLLVIDGPLKGRNHLPRALGYIKSHRAAYLPPEQHAMIGTLQAGERTPVFRMGTSWDRYSWYLRLPCLPSAPWAGIVRVECSPDLHPDEAIALAGLSQGTLVRFASTEYKDARAPQNLYPIAGLERELRRRLGDSRLLYRALRVEAHNDGRFAQGGQSHST
jgi:hypothetical protein